MIHIPHGNLHFEKLISSSSLMGYLAVHNGQSVKIVEFVVIIHWSSICIVIKFKITHMDHFVINFHLLVDGMAAWRHDLITGA